MGRHARATRPATGADGQREPGRLVRISRIALLVFLALSAAATVVGLVVQWPGDEEPRVAPEFESAFSFSRPQVTGTVEETGPGSCQDPGVGQVIPEGSEPQPAAPGQEECTHIVVELTSGQNEGERVLLVNNGLPGEANLNEGDDIRLSETDGEAGELRYAFTDYPRGTALLVWGALIVIAVVALAAWRGVRALIGLAVTLVVVAVFLLPALLRGASALPVAITASSAILLLVLALVHGATWKTASALGGTLIALALAAVLSSLAIETTNLRGLGSDDNLKILLYLPDVSVEGLLLCGFIIGALGALNDATVAQASTVNELAAADPKASPGRLFLAALRVGRDHIASMIYTLVLTYTGAALPLLLLLTVAGQPIGEMLSSDIMATELLRSIVGAIALTLAVPITTAIAAVTVTGRRGDGGHSHVSHAH